jgi:predicted P-loop ATPase
MIHNAFIHVLHKKGYHPIKEFIESVEWDGEIRVPNFFCDYLGAEHSTYTWEVTKRWFTGAVNRIYEPGCKFEIVPLLIGPKGLGKSFIGRKLANEEWFTDSLRSLDPKIAGEILANVWICEFPELRAFQGENDEEIKAFISSQEDVYRGAFERGKATKHKRHTVFFGTSNKNEVLTDETGERRRFPIKCSKERRYNPFTDLTPEIVAQIWAEAKVYYDEGYFTYIDSEIQEMAEEVFKNHKEYDPLEGEIDEYVKAHGAVCVRQIWDDIVADDQNKKLTRKDSNRIISILTSLGYEHIGFQRFEKYGTSNQRIYGLKD